MVCHSQLSTAALARVLHPSLCHERNLAVLKFFGDETGIDGKPATRISAVAGLIGEERAWGHFDRNWMKVLNSEGIPYFHAVECERGTENFYGLDVSKRGHIVDRLIQAVAGSSLQLCAYAVVVPHFRAMSEEFRLHYTHGHPDIPYYLCLAKTFVAASHAADGKPSTEQIYFLFEKQDKFEQEAGALFREFQKNQFWPNSSRLGDCHFAEKDDIYKYPGLQAADLIAYESYRHLDNKHFQSNLREEWKVRVAMKVLSKKLGQYGRCYDSEALAILEQERTSIRYSMS